MKLSALLALLSIVFVACTTYHASGPSGGFSETQLAPRRYQVRFQGNGYTSPDRVSQFLLRRSAELALENGFRYFVIGQPTDVSKHDALATFPAQIADVSFLDSLDADPRANDAVVVIRSTDAVAKGELSEKARAQIDKFARTDG